MDEATAKDQNAKVRCSRALRLRVRQKAGGKGARGTVNVKRALAHHREDWMTMRQGWNVCCLREVTVRGGGFQPQLWDSPEKSHGTMRGFSHLPNFTDQA